MLALLTNEISAVGPASNQQPSVSDIRHRPRQQRLAAIPLNSITNTTRNTAHVASGGASSIHDFNYATENFDVKSPERIAHSAWMDVQLKQQQKMQHQQQQQFAGHPSVYGTNNSPLFSAGSDRTTGNNAAAVAVEPPTWHNYHTSPAQVPQPVYDDRSFLAAGESTSSTRRLGSAIGRFDGLSGDDSGAIPTRRSSLLEADSVGEAQRDDLLLGYGSHSDTGFLSTYDSETRRRDISRGDLLDRLDFRSPLEVSTSSSPIPAGRRLSRGLAGAGEMHRGHSPATIAASSAAGKGSRSPGSAQIEVLLGKCIQDQQAQ